MTEYDRGYQDGYNNGVQDGNQHEAALKAEIARLESQLFQLQFKATAIGTSMDNALDEAAIMADELRKERDALRQTSQQYRPNDEMFTLHLMHIDSRFYVAEVLMNLVRSGAAIEHLKNIRKDLELNVPRFVDIMRSGPGESEEAIEGIEQSMQDHIKAIDIYLDGKKPTRLLAKFAESRGNRHTRYMLSLSDVVSATKPGPKPSYTEDQIEHAVVEEIYRRQDELAAAGKKKGSRQAHLENYKLDLENTTPRSDLENAILLRLNGLTEDAVMRWFSPR